MTTSKKEVQKLAEAYRIKMEDELHAACDVIGFFSSLEESRHALNAAVQYDYDLGLGFDANRIAERAKFALQYHQQVATEARLKSTPKKK